MGGDEIEDENIWVGWQVSFDVCCVICGFDSLLVVVSIRCCWSCVVGGFDSLLLVLMVFCCWCVGGGGFGSLLLVLNIWKSVLQT